MRVAPPTITIPSIESMDNLASLKALADLDSNNDGQFNAADAAFASVRLWKDANQNGISEAGELFTLAQLGVQGYVVPHVPSWFVGAARRALRQTTVELAC